MVQTANSTQAASLLTNRPDLEMFLRPFVRRKSTQRHCDHLGKLQPLRCNPRERKIECYEVALLLEVVFSELATHGYWEVDGLSSEGLAWTPIVCCETFELLVQCPPGKRITFVLNLRPVPVFLLPSTVEVCLVLTNGSRRLGNLDLVVILETCLEDANGGAFMRKLTSTSKCWPTGHVDFRWMLRGTLAEGAAALRGSTPSAVQRRDSVKKILSPVKRLQLDQSPETGRTKTVQQTPPPAGTPSRVAAPQTTPSRIKRWKSLSKRSPPLGGICASETSPSEQRRNSLKERASSLFQSKRQSQGSTSSASTSSSWYSRGSNTEKS